MYITMLGSTALALLQQEQDAALMGMTSRGAYLRLGCGWVIFLSTETPHGPLTLNLYGGLAPLAGQPHGATAHIQDGNIFFSEANVRLQTGQAAVWEPAPRPAQWLAADERTARLGTAMRLAMERKPDGSASLAALIVEDAPAPGAGTGFWRARLRSLRKSLVNGRTELIIQAMEPLLGYGNGLTPAGDDLALGLLLALRRWGDVICPGLDSAHLSQACLPLAYQKTTTLSANLIECAAGGLADERLILALDGLVSGAPEAAACAAMLAEWGHSSGLDALTGMALAVMAGAERGGI